MPILHNLLVMPACPGLQTIVKKFMVNVNCELISQGLSVQLQIHQAKCHNPTSALMPILVVPVCPGLQTIIDPSFPSFLYLSLN